MFKTFILPHECLTYPPERNIFTIFITFVLILFIHALPVLTVRNILVYIEMFYECILSSIVL